MAALGVPGACERPRDVPAAQLAGSVSRAQELLAAFRESGPPRDATPWELFYGLMGSGADFPCPASPHVSCRTWLLEEATWKPVFMGSPIARELDGNAIFLGDLEPGRPLGLEGHFCQWLFVLAQTGATHETRIGLPPDGREGMLASFIAGSRAQCSSASDLSWALPVLTKWYDGPWRNRFGERFDADVLAEQHLRQRETSVACMGAHWRIGLASALATSPRAFSPRVRERLRKAMSECLAQAEKSCAADGRLSPGGTPLAELEMVTSFQAHTLEWILMMVTEEELRASEWVNRAVARLESDLRYANLSYGTRCHAAFALRLFLEKAGRPLRLTDSPPGPARAPARTQGDGERP